MSPHENRLLIINVGSATIKTRLFDPQLLEMTHLDADYGGTQGTLLKSQTNEWRVADAGSARQALALVFDEWKKQFLASGARIAAIGHRIVHGGSDFSAPTLLTPAVMERLALLDAYAPLHNPLNRLGAAMAAEAFPGIPQYGVFDTAFHHHMPDYACRYPIPPGLSGHVEFSRYGFHGISCRHSLSRAKELLQKDAAQINCIILHLGGGASATAVQGGVGVDTSMGFSPTEGLMMATRSGDVDPMIVLTLLREGWTVDRLDRLLNRESGLFGVCGTGDMREVLQRAESGDELAGLAVDIYCYRIKKYIGAYSAVLGRVDALIFTGGVGEHAPAIRQRIVQGLDNLGFALDAELNLHLSEQDRDIGSPASRNRILVIHAEEEREIAAQILTVDLKNHAND